MTFSQSDLDRAAVKCVNELVERHSGNCRLAQSAWHKEIKELPYGWKYRRYVHAVCLAFKEMRPGAQSGPEGKG